jgi:hypothetical protein
VDDGIEHHRCHYRLLCWVRIYLFYSFLLVYFSNITYLLLFSSPYPGSVLGDIQRQHPAFVEGASRGGPVHPVPVHPVPASAAPSRASSRASSREPSQGAIETSSISSSKDEADEYVEPFNQEVAAEEGLSYTGLPPSSGSMEVDDGLFTQPNSENEYESSGEEEEGHLQTILRKFLTKLLIWR